MLKIDVKGCLRTCNRKPLNVQVLLIKRRLDSDEYRMKKPRNGGMQAMDSPSKNVVL